MEKEKIQIPDKLYEKNSNGKILYIRHGQTNYNKNSNKSNLNIMKIKPEYIDCDLNEKGIEQTNKLSNQIIKLKIEQIYVSPLSRALHTALILFKNHPEKDNIIIKIHPLITEVISGVHGFVFDIQNSKKIYNMNSEIKFDWSIFDSYYNSFIEQDLFFFNFIDCFSEKKLKEKKEKIYSFYGKENFKNKLGEFSKLGVDSGFKRFETLNHLFKRNLEFKKFLYETHKNNLNELDKKIIIITDSAFTQISTSKKAYLGDLKNIFPNDCCKMNNCEIISIFI
jgi:bisphosphoglycerate-dependent phosphoglycerate mutase